MVTVAGVESAMPSFALYVNASVPDQPESGAYVKEPSP